MGLLDRYRQAPPSISGRRRHDIVLGITDASVGVLWAVSGAIRKVRPPPDPDRVITLTVLDRQVVAHDQDVVALTLAATDGRPLPRWHPGAHLDIHLPSGRLRQYSLCGRPRRRRHLSDRCAPDRRRWRRIDRGARRVVRRRHGDHSRSAQRLPAHRAGLRLPHPAVPVHRGRDRHHADSADAGACRSPRRGLVDGVCRPKHRQPALRRRGQPLWGSHRDPHRRRQRRSDRRPTPRRLCRRHDGLRVRTRADADRRSAPRSRDATTSSSISNGSPHRRSSTGGSSRCRSLRRARRSWSAPTRRC